MLDISFYSYDRKVVDVVEVSPDFYKWLSQSDFSKIGKSQEVEMKGDEEVVTVSVIPLEGENRRKLSNFFRDEIVTESDHMLGKLGDLPSKQEYIDASSRLRILQDLRRLVEDEKIKYLSRD